ncbi:MAG TPA: hypothetical protein VMS77_05115 [Conexivisphaerales archaeon]|nr:hypothetical protein [Conexivisphaerales archaeon]
MSSYSLIPSLDAVYKIAANQAAFMVRSEGPLEIREASSGLTQVDLAWHPPRSAKKRWHPHPTMASPEPLQFTTSDVDDGSRLYEFLLEDIFPAFGFVKEDCSGTIVAPAAHFVPEGAPDFWVLLLHSGWMPPRPQVELPLLDLGGGAQATLDTGNSGVVVSEVTNPEGEFEKVSLYVRRELGQFETDQLLGEVPPGQKKTCLWMPVLRDFGTVFIMGAGSKLGQFTGFLQQFGAEVASSSLERGSLKDDFVLCDGPGTGYTLRLVGARKGGGAVAVQGPLRFAADAGAT